MARGAPGEEVYTPEVQAWDLPRKVTPEASAEDFGAGIGRGIAAITDTLDRKYQADSATWAGDQIADFRAGQAQKLEDMKAAQPAGDPGNFTERYLAGFDRDAGPLVEKASRSSPLARQMVERGLVQLRDTLAGNTHEWEATQRIASQNASLQDNLDKQLPAVRLHPEMAAQVGQGLMDQVNATRNDPATKLKFARSMDTQLTQTAALGLVDKDPGDVYLQLKSGSPTDPILNRLTDPISRQQVLEQAQAGVVQKIAQGALEQYRTGGPEVGAKAYAAVDNLTLPDPMKDQVRTEIHKDLNALYEQKRTQYADTITNLETGIASGSPPANAKATADSLYHDNALDQQQYATMLSGIVRAQKKENGDAQLLAYGIGAFNSRKPLDPKDTQDSNAANMVFSSMIGKEPPGSAAYNNAAIAITEHTGIIPHDAVSWARANLTSGDAQSAAAAANLLSRLQETNPRSFGFAVDESDKETRAIVASVNDAVKAGTDPTVAVNLARKNQELPQAALDALRDQWKTTKAETTQPDALASILKSDPAYKPGWFTGLPKVPPLMQGEFNQLTQDYYKRTGGNLLQSRQLAAQDLKRTWGVSEVNGQRELMQWAPEAMFPGLSAGVVRDDIAQTVKDNAEAFQSVDPSKVRLTATARTARTGGQDWTLSVPDEFGAYDVVRGKDGNPLTYRLPVSGKDYQTVRDRQNQADLQRARQKQGVVRDFDRAQPNESDAERGSVSY